MNTEKTDGLLKRVCDEIKTIEAKPTWDATALNNLNILVDIKKDLYEIMEKEQMLNGYSERPMTHVDMRYKSEPRWQDRGYVIQPYYQNDMVGQLRRMADSMPQHKRDMTYDFINRLETM